MNAQTAQVRFIEGRGNTLYKVLRDDGCCVLQVAVHDDLDSIGKSRRS